MRKIEIDRDELHQYYIVKNHTLKETAKHFKVSPSTITARLKEGDIKKTIQIDKDELYQYYIVENHNQEETAKHFKVTRNTIMKRLKKHGIQKTKEQSQAKMRATCLENWGYENPMQNPEVQARVWATNMERRGFKYTWQDPEVKAKSQATNLERRGYENPMQDPKVKAKTRATNLERRGYEYVFQDPEVKAKTRATNLKRRGYEYASQDPEVKAKARATNKERRGVEYPAQDPKVLAKMRATCLEKYGYEYPAQSPKVQAKRRATCLEIYGYEHPTQSSFVQEKTKATNREKYGCDWSSQNIKVQEKTRKNNIEKYGSEHPLQKHNCREEMIKDCQELGITLDDDETSYSLTEKFLKSQNRKKSITEVAKFRRTSYNAGLYYIKNHPKLDEDIKHYPRISAPEQEVYDFLKENYAGEIIQSDRAILKPLEIDILFPDLKIGIEFNGLHFHRTMRDPNDTPHRDKYYHQNKTKGALEKGYRLIHMTDDEWKNHQESIKVKLLEELNIDSSKLSKSVKFIEPGYYYTDEKKQWGRDDPDLPKALSKIFSLELDEDEEWTACEKAGYYRYYDDGCVLEKEEEIEDQTMGE